MMVKSLLFLLYAMLLLSACAVRGPLENDPAALLLWQQRQPDLAALAEWSFNGRVLLKKGADSVKMSLLWQQQAHQFDIRLMSVLGQQQARIQSMLDGEVRLVRPGKPVRYARSAATLLYQEFGLTFPLAGLRYWALGLPVPALEADWLVDAKGRLQWLLQDGWRIEFSAYQLHGGRYLPRKIRLFQGELQARLVIDSWTLDGLEHSSPGEPAAVGMVSQ